MAEAVLVDTAARTLSNLLQYPQEALQSELITMAVYIYILSGDRNGEKTPEEKELGRILYRQRDCILPRGVSPDPPWVSPDPGDFGQWVWILPARVFWSFPWAYLLFLFNFNFLQLVICQDEIIGCKRHILQMVCT
jgi:hypothetical protein